MYMKKLILTVPTIFLLNLGLLAQNGKMVNQQKAVAETKQGAHRLRNCGTPAPGAQWDAMFNKMVDTYKSQHVSSAKGKIAATNYTIPIIFHIISYSATGTVPVGNYPNISQAQVNSQVAVLNADYGGTGVGVSTYTALTSGGHGPFYDYATANSLPAPDNTNSGILPVNTGITFSLVTINPNGLQIPEPGIDRINAYTLTPTSPYTNTNPRQAALTATNFNNFIDMVIKPQTIWDPTKYFNVWVTDCDSSTIGLLGYTTFPGGTGLAGITAVGTATTDGCWIYAKAIGNTGTLEANYDLGRTLTHESGHYFGLRHTWGDGSACPAATDYCNDTPPEEQATYYGYGTSNATYVYPYTTNTCTSTGAYNSDLGDGIMYMNFMDYADDAFMSLFTNDQLTRMQAALSQSPNRSGLTASAAIVCVPGSLSPVASFTYPLNICPNGAAVFTDVSTNMPTSWTWCITPNSGVSINTSTSQNPMITFSYTGSYSVTLLATNTVGSTSVTQVVTVIGSPTLTVNSPSICIGTTATLTAAGVSTFTWNTGETTPVITPSPTITTTYTVSGTAGTCVAIATATTTIMVNPVPTANLVGAHIDSANCGVTYGAISGINAANISGGSPPYQYQWYSGGTPVLNGTLLNLSGIKGGTYSLQITDINGCAANIVGGTSTFTIPDISMPSVSFSIQPDSVPHIWDLYVNYSADVTNANWYWGDGTSTSDLYSGHGYDSAGTYNICVVAYNGCGDSAVFCLSDSLYRSPNNSPLNNMLQVKVIEATTGINQLSLNNNRVAVYPNPSNGSFIIETKSNVHCILYNVNGSEVLNQIVNGKTTIDASNLSEGVYNLSIIGKEGVVNKRVVIVR